jgi:hypothetical protein
MPKPSAKSPEKVECINPNTGRRMNIDASTWELFSKAIKTSLKGGKELTFTEIVEAVEKYLKQNKINFQQSVGWYAVTVKQDLQVRKEVEVFTQKGRKLHRLPKAKKQ